MSSTTAEPSIALTYATPSAAAGSPVAAGVWVCLCALMLVFFGGCFCIGILALTTSAAFSGSNGSPLPLTWEQDLLMFVLYVCALACFATGAYSLFLGLRKLLAVGR